MSIVDQWLGRNTWKSDLNLSPAEMYMIDNGTVTPLTQEAVLPALLKQYSLQEEKNTKAANDFQLQLMNQQIGATQRENALDRQYTTAERLAAQEYSTSERLAAQQYNSAEAQKQRDWQTEMSNTSFQRAVKDLVAAGINPIAALGNGASTPSGSAASISGARSSGSSGPGRSFSSASAFKRDFSKILDSVLGYMTDMKSLDQEKELKGRQLDIADAGQTLNFISSMMSVFKFW